ncbi:sigma-70 family RNA polymerase sigma factor [Streptomyces radicis]|uniref:Sigma-70 family RNA polymerase sigma factor n=1 Tax=Streptomyces radicis TaxID=1750517 RepID=A0A3A9VXU4_9ACTN|nr:sigma-70 family RNA polymerase sigma factor [Streptomyces radicis]RKN05569.1 sigma-70 family RNA polymerase sigma factor [Streptomyces radicis]RKN17438.1 sigma-70 family RNA polymerase sigma factor [Streptomyces radicis]
MTSNVATEEQRPDRVDDHVEDHVDDRVQAPDAEPGVEQSLERYRKELTGYCYRMLGSAFEAEDAVQDTMVRAWRAYDRFEGRSSVRSWLYRIATNVCLTMLSGSSKRARPMDLTSPTPHASAVLGPPLAETAWIEPMPDGMALPQDPAERAEARESVRLAFVAALQHLAPKQRAVLILREVLAWKAGEVAELLDTTVASVNSALQRARATLAATGATESDPSEPLSDDHKALLARYLEAFESYDMDALTALLAEDATLSMPPFALWFRGPADIEAWMVGEGKECRGSRLIPTSANGCAAFGQYRPAPEGGHSPWALQVIEISGGHVIGINAFLDTARLFPLFGLPSHLPEAEPADEAR